MLTDHRCIPPTSRLDFGLILASPAKRIAGSRFELGSQAHEARPQTRDFWQLTRARRSISHLGGVVAQDAIRKAGAKQVPAKHD